MDTHGNPADCEQPQPVEAPELEPAEPPAEAQAESIAPTPPSGRAVWDGVAMSGLGAARLRISVSDLGDAERAELRVEIECDPESDAGMHTREPGQQQAGLGLLLRAGGRSGVFLVSELLRMLASKVDVALLLASVPNRDADLGEPLPPADPDAFPAVLEGNVLDPEPNPESSLDLLRATFAQIYDRNGQ